MKETQKQTGSVHVVVIVILVIATVGLLGFVLWQNFVQKDSSQSSSDQQSSTTVSDTKATSQTNTTAKILTISQFTITLSRPSDDDSYYVIPQDDFAVYISNDKLDAYLNSGIDCEVKGVQLSKIPTASATDNDRVYSSDINGYKYGIGIGLPNFAKCNNNQELITTFTSVRDALIGELPSLK